MPLPHINVAPAKIRTKTSAPPQFSELNNTASTLTVYASDFDCSTSARLVSGDWQSLTGWISTTGLHCQFQDNLLSSIPKLQTWPGAVFFKPVQKIAGGVLFQFSSLPIFAFLRLRRRIRPVSGGNQPAISIPVSLQCCSRKLSSLRILCPIYRLLDSAEQLDHVPGPRLLILLLDKDQFSKMVCIAQRMKALEIKVRFPSIMDNPTQILTEHSTSLYRRTAALFMAEEVGVEGRAAAVSPESMTIHIHSRLIQMHCRAAAKRILDRRFGRFQIAIRQLQCIVDGPFAHRNPEDVIEHFNASFLRQQLVYAEIGQIRPNPRTILNRRINSFGKRRGMDLPATALEYLRTVFGVLQCLRWRDIGDLATFEVNKSAVLDISAACASAGKRMNDPMMRIFDPLESETLMPRLAAALSLTFLTKTLGSRTKKISRRGFTAVMAVFINYAFKPDHFLFEKVEPVDQHGDKTDDRLFPLPVDGSDVVGRHFDRHEDKLLPGTSVVYHN
jgi:hypothetical protein